MTFSKRVYDMGIWDFVAWYYSDPRSFQDLQVYMAVGIGDTAWDEDPVAPAGTETGLYSEYCRVKPYIQQPVDELMLDAGKVLYKEDGNLVFRFVAEFPGSIIQTLKKTGTYIREIGLFVGASGEANSGSLMVLERHPRIWWGTTFMLRREILVDLRG